MSVLRNKRAFYDYEILEQIEAGVVLSGAEVKSLREGRGSIKEAFVSVRDGQAYIKSMHIARWRFSTSELMENRDRKLLLHKRQIVKFQKKLDEKGLSIIPLELRFVRGYAKIKVALAKGKKQYDKRSSIKDRDVKRQLDRKIRAF